DRTLLLSPHHSRRRLEQSASEAVPFPNPASLSLRLRSSHYRTADSLFVTDLSRFVQHLPQLSSMIGGRVSNSLARRQNEVCAACCCDSDSGVLFFDACFCRRFCKCRQLKHD